MKPLFGPDGKPLMLVGTDAEKQEALTKAILIECFGAIAGITPLHEWKDLAGGVQEGATRLLDAIIDRVGREPLVERFKVYGVRFEAPEDPDSSPTDPRAPAPPSDGEKGHSNPTNPYRKVLGWPTRES